MADFLSAQQSDVPLKVLLVQDNPAYVQEVTEKLSRNTSVRFEIRPASTLGGALQFLSQEKMDAILLELSLPDSSGIETFKNIRSAASMTPVVILTYLDDEMLALQAVREGAQDYLLKGGIDGKFLRRVILYAIERQRMQTKLFSLSIIDDLTGLYNRRGFLILAEQQMKLAHRAKKGLLLFLADLDGLKQVNDTYGHPQGDMALRFAAEILQKTFRKSDIIARLGGDEFAMVAIEADLAAAEILNTRLKQNLDEFNRSRSGSFSLSLSVGFSHFDAQNKAFVEQLISQADTSLYEQKRIKRKELKKL